MIDVDDNNEARTEERVEDAGWPRKSSGTRQVATTDVPSRHRQNGRTTLTGRSEPSCRFRGPTAPSSLVGRSDGRPARQSGISWARASVGAPPCRRMTETTSGGYARRASDGTSTDGGSNPPASITAPASCRGPAR